MSEHPIGPVSRFAVIGSTIDWLTETSSSQGAPFTVALDLEPEWQSLDDQTWFADGLELRLTVNEGPNQSILLFTLSNSSDSPLRAKMPDLRLSGSAPIVWWMGSGLDYVAHLGPDLVQVLRPTGGGFLARMTPQRHLVVTSTQELTLSPGQEHLTIWRAGTLTSPDQLRTDLAPHWYPATPVVEQGQEITLSHPDGVVQAATLEVEVNFPDFVLRKGRGIHLVNVLGPSGDRSLRLGWAKDLAGLVAEALSAEAQLPSDLEAWFLVWQMSSTGRFSNQQLDLVDLKIAQSLEDPSPFALAAAADATPFLGQGVLSEATAALLTMDPQHIAAPGLPLAGFRLYAQAAATDSTLADRIAGMMGSISPRSSVEIELLADPDHALDRAQQLARELGFCAPGFVPTGCGYKYALLKVSLSWETSKKHFHSLSRVLSETERWLRSQEIPPSELAWLLW